MSEHFIYVFFTKVNTVSTASGTGCSRLMSPENGHLFDLGNKIGDTIHVKCNDGYRLGGDSSRTCQDNGDWSGETATCEASQESGKGQFKLLKFE